MRHYPRSHFKTKGGISPYWRSGRQIVDRLGINGLKLCLDAGDKDSYPGTGQTWFDISGEDTHFHLGADGDAGTDDPTFNGAAGRHTSNEFWSLDGGDFFRCKTSPTWLDAFHQNNAAGSLLMWMQMGSLGSYGFIGNASHENQNDIGFSWRANGSSDQLQMVVFNGDGSTVVEIETHSSELVAGQWQCIATSLDEASDEIIHMRNGIFSTDDWTYSSPSALAASNPIDIGTRGNGANILPEDSRIAMVLGFDEVLSEEELTAIYELSGGRFL